MGWFSWIAPGNDRELAKTQYAGRESATDRAVRIRRERHNTRVNRDGDDSGARLPRRYRKHGNGACG
jgi:hypothetical protein